MGNHISRLFIVAVAANQIAFISSVPVEIQSGTGNSYAQKSINTSKPNPNETIDPTYLIFRGVNDSINSSQF